MILFSLKLKQNNNVTKICQFERARVTFVTHGTADIGMNGFVPENDRFTSLYRGLMDICVFKDHSTILNTANQPKIIFVAN